MRRARFFTVNKRVFRDLKNDKRSLALIVIAPIFVMFIFGLAFSGEVRNVKVIVVNQDGGAEIGGSAMSLSEKIISNLDEEVLKLEYMDQRDTALEVVENGDAYAVIFFPADFTATVLSGIQDRGSGSSADIELLLDKSNINVANAITKALNDALLATIDQAGIPPPLPRRWRRG